MGCGVFGPAYSTSGSVPLPVTPINHSGEGGAAPKAYLNYIFIDKNFNPASIRVLYDRLESGKENGADVPHDMLTLTDLVTEQGYVYIYLSNDNLALGGAQVEVYFDDFKVEHVKSPVVSSQDYYPFGLTFNSHNRENSTINKYLYNGKEIQDALNLGWFDYGARAYMPDIGRWNQVDPSADQAAQEGDSPYSYVAGNPVSRTDPDGRIWDTVIDVISLAVDVVDMGVQYITKGEVGPVAKAAFAADVVATVTPGLTGAGFAVRLGGEGAEQAGKRGARSAMGDSRANVSNGPQIRQNAAEGARREQVVTEKLKDGPGEILEQRTLVDDKGKKLTGSDGKGRRLDQVRVEGNKVTETFETTSPTEATRSRKQQQVNRGDEIIGSGNANVKDKSGNLIPVDPNAKTQVIKQN